MHLYVTEAVAYKYATDELTADQIKAMHDQHLHYPPGSLATISPGCPECPWCVCPVPEAEHERTRPLPTDHKNESDS